ncbi:MULTISPECIES: DsbA family protein [Halobacillus]|uniref:DsbA family protein n=1 Tax=Halobacillus TaxID=45667 RepID=UPI0009A8E506|nr:MULTISPECIES: DsbA family protein [Halobacillus]
MSKKNPMPIIMVVTLVIIGLITTLVLLNNQSESAGEKESHTTSESPSIKNHPTMGEDNAPVQIIEFGDYKCPACKKWSKRVYPQLKEEFIDTGKANFTYINTPFHGEGSKLAAQAGEAVYKQKPEAFWDFHKALFEAQPDVNHDQKWLSDEKVLEVAEESVPSIDLTQMRQDLHSGAISQEVQNDTDLVNEYDVQQTPTIMINGQILENPFDYKAITSLINQNLDDNNG